MSARTHAVRAGLNTDAHWDAVVPPISLSTTHRRADPDNPGAFDYARTGHPGRARLAAALADLDGAAGALVTSSGMAAIDLLLHGLPHGARLVCAHDAYGGTRRLIDARAAGGRFQPVYADLTDAASAAAALSEPTALVLAETPSNPRLRLTDLAALADLAHAAGAELAVDNTALSPALQRPIDWGADYVVQSITKLVNGHSDMVGGSVSVKDEARIEPLAWWLNCAGTGAGAFDAFLALRGLRTLDLRARAQSETALEIARRLAKHPGVAAIDYPGLVTHPGHALALRQQDAFGPLISFTPKQPARELVAKLEIFTCAQSLGGVESLCCIPAAMTHASMSADARREAGIGDELVRLSVGLESADDLIADLEQALG